MDWRVILVLTLRRQILVSSECSYCVDYGSCSDMTLPTEYSDMGQTLPCCATHRKNIKNLLKTMNPTWNHFFYFLYDESCSGSVSSGEDDCYCDTQCINYGDCCSDHQSTCAWIFWDNATDVAVSVTVTVEPTVTPYFTARHLSNHVFPLFL